MNRLNRLCLILICLPLFIGKSIDNIQAQTNKNIQSVQTVALSRDALKIGKNLRHSALEFRQFSHKMINGHPESIFLSNDHRQITVFHKYPQAEHVLHNLFRFQHNGAWGLVDDQGRIVVSPVYHDLWIFEVNLDQGKKTLLWIELPNPDPELRQGFRAHHQFLIDVNTGIVINREPMYSLGISALENDISSGLIPAQPVSADGPHGYMDLHTGSMHIPANFLYAAPFQEHRAVVIVTHEHAQKLCKQDLNKTAQKGCKHPHLAPPPCNNQRHPYDAQACFIAENMDYYGYGVIDTQGTFVSRFDYDYIQSFHHQKAIFKRENPQNSEASIGYLNDQGNEILKGYTEAMPFLNPYDTYVKFPNRGRDTGWNWIDTQGTVYAIHANPQTKLTPKSPKTKPRLNFVTPFEIHGALYTEHSSHLDTYILEEPVVSHSGAYIASIIVNDQGHIIWPKLWDNPCTYTYDIVVWPENACFVEKFQQHQINIFKYIYQLYHNLIGWIDLALHELEDHTNPGENKHSNEKLWIEDPQHCLTQTGVGRCGASPASGVGAYLPANSDVGGLAPFPKIIKPHHIFKQHHLDSITWADLIYSWIHLDIYRYIYYNINKLARYQTYQMPPLEPYLTHDTNYVRIGFGPRHVKDFGQHPGFYAPRHAHGILDASTGRVLFRPGKYTNIQHGIGNLFIYSQDGKFGLMDDQENVIIPPQFLDIDFIIPERSTENWINNAKQIIDQIHNNTLNTNHINSNPNPFGTKPHFVQTKHQIESPQSILLRISVLDQSYNPDNDEMTHVQKIPVIRFYYDAITGKPKPDMTDQAFIHVTQTHPVLTHIPNNPPQLNSTHWFVERIQTIKHTTNDPEPVYYEVLVDQHGKPANHNDLKQYSTVVQLHQNTAVVQLQNPADPLNPLELRCLEQNKKSHFTFASFMPETTSEGATCVQINLPTIDSTQNNINNNINITQNGNINNNINTNGNIQKSFITSCDLPNIIEVESCTTNHVTPFVQGHAWVKPKNAQTFQRINTQGQIVGNFEIRADKAIFHHGVYRFSTTIPSPENGWKYPEIIVSTDGKILWPRGWHQDNGKHLGNLVFLNETPKTIITP